MRQLSAPLTPTQFLAKAWRLTQRLADRTYRRTVFWLDEFKPFIRTLSYKGFQVYYSKGTSIIEFNGMPPVRFGGTYEPPETEAILRLLQGPAQPVLVDVGANIGLMSLNVLEALPQTRIFAFEPSPHPRSLFQKTIAANQLQSRITLYPEALGAAPGQATFAIHPSEHTSGDGFRDTGRAGAATLITVVVQTLDHWWQSVERPAVTLIKLDTEGAELWVLQGAVQLLTGCRPTLILEICNENLHAYPYSALDLLRWLEDQGYRLTTLGGQPVTPENLESTLQSDYNFIAYPHQAG